MKTSEQILRENTPPFFFCRDTKTLCHDIADVKTEYFLIDESCKIGETKQGLDINVRNKRQALTFAKNMGWYSALWAKSNERN